METKTIHIQFDDNKKYIGQVNPAEQLKKGYLNIEVSADEHEDIEKNKDSADYVHNFLAKKSGKKFLTEISKEKLKDYIRANVEDRLLRTSGASFKSGKAGDEYNKADETETDEKRKKGLDKAMDKLTKEDLDESLQEASFKEFSQMDADQLSMEAFKASKDANNSRSLEKHHRASKLHSMAAEKYVNKGISDLAAMHDKHYNKHLDKVEHLAGYMKESFGAKILSSIINNKPIDAQEQFGHALGEIIRSKMDTLRQEVGARIFNKVD